MWAGAARAVDGAALSVGSGGGGLSSVGSMRWGGGQPPVGLSGKLPAAVMDRPVMGPAQEYQVGQVGGAAIQPVPQVVSLTPGQGPVTARDDTAAVADGQGGSLAGLDDPGGPADVQGLAGRPPRTGGSRAAASWSRQPAVVRGMVVLGAAGVVMLAGGVAGDQDPGHGAVAGQPPTRPIQGPRPVSPPRRLRPRGLSRFTTTISWGRTPPVWGSRPWSRLRRASSVRASAGRWPPLGVS
jgi:hypothetical protein